MQNYKQHFKGKKVTVMGLGLLGGGLNDTRFLAECGAELTVTDLKSSSELRSSLEKLGKYKNIKYVLGEHRLEDFQTADLIIQPGNVPMDSPYLAEAKKNKIPVYVSESLFAQYADGVILVGITGTRGKTTTTQLIYALLKAAKKKVYLGGNIKDTSTLGLLSKVKPGDIVVMELDSWALHGLGEIKKSPHVAVFTNFLKDHLNFYMNGGVDESVGLDRYFMDKAQIFAHQTASDYLILDKDIQQVIKENYRGQIKSQIKVIDDIQTLKDWDIKLKGEHNLKHILRAMEVGKIFGLDNKLIKKVLENFTAVPGRQELIRTYRGIKIYNDTTATTPDGALVALKSLGDKERKNLVLIFGGADKKLDMSGLIKEIPNYCKATILLSGTGTTKLKSDYSNQTKNIVECGSLKEAVQMAIGLCEKGDTLVLSPGFASFGMFKNEYDRGDQFTDLIKALK